MRRKNDGTTHGGMKQAGETVFHRRQPTYWGLGKQRMMLRRSQPGCRAEDVRTLAGGDMSVDRWREGTPPGIGTMPSGNRDTKKGKQDREASGEVGTTGVQGEGETGDQPGERRAMTELGPDRVRL